MNLKNFLYLLSILSVFDLNVCFQTNFDLVKRIFKYELLDDEYPYLDIDVKNILKEIKAKKCAYALLKLSLLSKNLINDYKDKLFFNNGNCYYFENKEDNEQDFYGSITQCKKKFSNHSSLFYLNQTDKDEFEEYNFVKSKLILFDKKKSGQHFYIGLKYSNSTKYWIWSINQQSVPNEFLNKLKIDNSSYLQDQYAYLEINSSFKKKENVSLTTTDENNNKKYICRFSNITGDHCFNNPCVHGKCYNDFNHNTYRCSCNLFHGGMNCHKWSVHTNEIIICFSIILLAFFFGLSINFFRKIKTKFKNKKLEINSENLDTKYEYLTVGKYESFLLENYCEKESISGFKIQFKKQIRCLLNKRLRIFIFIILSVVFSILIIFGSWFIKNKIKNSSNITHNHRYLKLILDHKDVICQLKNNFNEDNLLILISLPLTFTLYIWNNIKNKNHHSNKCKYFKENTNSFDLSPVKLKNKIFIKLKLLFRYFILCSCGFELPIPVNPFSKTNRLITSVIFTAYLYNISKIFEFSIFVNKFSPEQTNYSYLKTNFNLNFSSLKHETFNKSLKLISKIESENELSFNLLSLIKGSVDPEIWKNGLLFNLFFKILSVIIIGFHYYPLFLCIEFKIKSFLNYFLCSVYIWLILAYYIFMSIICQSYEKPEMFDLIRKYIKELFFDIRPQNLNSSLEETNLKEALYENLFFYLTLCFIGLILSSEAIVLFYKNILKYYFWLYENSNYNNDITNNWYQNLENDIKYVKYNLLKNSSLKTKSYISFFKHVFETYVYKNRRYFKFSKQFISTNLIIVFLIYNLTVITTKSSDIIIDICMETVNSAIVLIFSQFDEKKNNQLSQINEKIFKINKIFFKELHVILLASCYVTSIICIIQIYLGIKNYQKHILNAFKGIYVDIPGPIKLSNSKIISSSFHYSGFSIGYFLWGYLSLLMVMFLLTTIVKLLFSNLGLMEWVAKIVLPIVTIFFFRKYIIWYITIFFLANSSKKRLGLKNKRLFLLLNHFNFFFDCFLMTFICFIRIIASSFATVFFMSRLDYSMFGRHLEVKDKGFMSFVCFLHLEVDQTHPVKLVFCDILLNSIKKEDDCKNSTASRYKNKWKVLYTLLNNTNLKKQRKCYLNNNRTKIESIFYFLKRKFSKKYQKKSNNK